MQTEYFRDKRIIEAYGEALNNGKDIEQITNILKKAYQFIKDITPKYLEDKKRKNDIKNLYYLLCSYESDVKPSLKIIDTDPIFDLKQANSQNILTLNNDEDIIEFIVNQVRKNLVLDLNKKYKNIKIDLKDSDLENYCKLASINVMDICRKLHLSVQRYRLDPGFCKMAKLYSGSGYHYFTVVSINNKSYLIDCTYAQFFNLRDNIIDRLGILNGTNCYPGVYMLQTEERKNVALTILKKGYILLTPNTLKHYLDGFALSYRNGLYYEKLGQACYTTSYDYDTYMNFLNGEDNQINHEGIEVLGRQLKPLNNPNFKF